jgi:predicted lipid-binding transport protein (Tim44 family)
MSDGFAYLDILFFAMIAAFVVLRLGSVLGRRTGHERRRQSPAEASAPDRVVPLRRPKGEPEAEETAGVADAGDRALKAGLTEIRLADPRFDLDHFLEGARAAFEMILGAFARGDKDTLRMLLAPDVYERFAQDIDRRIEAGHSLTVEVVAIRRAEVVEAGMRGRHARIAVRFVSEQITATRDADRHLIDGNPSKIVEVEDLWTFERDVRSSDPNWQLVETRVPG